MDVFGFIVAQEMEESPEALIDEVTQKMFLSWQTLGHGGGYGFHPASEMTLLQFAEVSHLVR